jgi:hypothetical protein
VSAFVNLSAVTVVSPDGVTFVCVDCSISSRGRYATYDRARMLLHLYMHQATGDYVPPSVIDRVRGEHPSARTSLMLPLMMRAGRLRRVEMAAPARDFL